MRHRIRAAGLILQHDCILLVLHRNPNNGVEFWVPPGGGLIATDDSIFAAAKREIFEETGLTVEINRISHIREFRDLDNHIHHIEFFMPVESYAGELTISNVRAGDEDAPFIQAVKWIKRTDLSQILVYPEWLQSDQFGNEANLNFPETRYTESASGTSKLMFGYTSNKKNNRR